MTQDAPAVALLGVHDADEVARMLAGRGHRACVLDGMPTSDAIGAPVLCIGPRAPWAEVRAWLESPDGAMADLEIVLASHADRHELEGLLDRHAGVLPLAADAGVDAIVEAADAAVRSYRARRARASAAWGDATLAMRVQRAAGRIHQHLRGHDDPARLAGLLDDALRELIGIDHLQLWRVDAEERLVAVPDVDGVSRPLIGIAGLAARLGTALASDDVERDPRIQPAVDLHAAPDAARGTLLAVPVVDAFAQVVVVAVLLRSPERGRFDGVATGAATDLLGAVAPHLLRHYAPDPEAIGGREVARRERLRRGVFRPEAIAARERAPDETGVVLRLEEPWVPWLYRAMVIGALALLAFAWLARVGEYAQGPAVVQLGERTGVNAPEAGTVSAVLVQPGERVRARQPLVRMQDQAERNAVARLQQEFDARLRERLRDPGAERTGNELIQARTRLDDARDRADARVLRAPHDGVASDVRVRPGLSIAEGDTLMAVVRDARRNKVVALLPGGMRPRLAPAQVLRLELAGFPYSYHVLRVTRVGEDVIGEREVRRAFGPAIADAVDVEGGNVMVEAELAGTGFVGDGRRYRLHNGMLGRAEVRIGDAPVILALVPALRAMRRDRKVGDGG